MKYQPPFGRESEGDSASYVNGNPVEGRQGSIPPAAAFEYPMRELVAMISKSKIAPSDTDLMQLVKGVRSQAVNYAQDTGSQNNLSVSFDPPIGTYTLGLPLKVKVAVTNTGPATIDAGGAQGRVAVINMKGASLEAGDLPGNGVAEMVFNGSAFQLVNFLGQGGGGTGPTTTYMVNIPFAKDVSTTPNIIDASFTMLPGTYTLKAGDPFLVQINNTNSGSSLARFRTQGGALPDQPIRANGGGTAPLIQGDLAKDDVVLFIYDGTQFWIQPNPIITADITLNIPSQYATPEAALLAIRRKSIAQNAHVTLLMAKGAGPATGYGGQPGCYNTFKINHRDADRVIVRGEMKIAGNLTGPMFAQTGNSAAARAADSSNNLNMLRQRFGVEIVVPMSIGGNNIGVMNDGPGTPLVQDILITGPNVYSGDPLNGPRGVGLAGDRSMSVTNVSVWGCDMGMFGSGVLIASYCFACGCFVNGFHGTANALYGTSNSGAFGNGGAGMLCNQNSWIGTFQCWTNYNASFGFGCGDHSQATFHTSQSIGNAYVDIYAGPVSHTIVLSDAAGGGHGTETPARGVLSAYAALISVSP